MTRRFSSSPARVPERPTPWLTDRLAGFGPTSDRQQAPVCRGPPLSSRPARIIYARRSRAKRPRSRLQLKASGARRSVDPAAYRAWGARFHASEEPSPQVTCCDEQLHGGDRDPVSEKCHEGHRTSVLHADAAGNDIG